MARKDKRYKRKLTDEQRTELLRLYGGTGMSAREIGYMFHITKSAVNAIAYREGVVKWDPSSPPGVVVRKFLPYRHVPEVNLDTVARDKDVRPTDFCRCAVICDWCCGIDAAEPTDWRIASLKGRTLKDLVLSNHTMRIK